MFRIHAKRNPSISPKVFVYKTPDIKNIMVCYFWGGEDVIKMWSKMFENRGRIAIELDSELTQELTEQTVSIRKDMDLSE